MSRSNQQVLTAVVFNQPIAMIPAVELEDQALGAIVEVGPPQETPADAANVDLNLRPRQACLNQEPPQPGLHGRFRRLCEACEAAQSCCAGATLRSPGLAPQPDNIDESALQRHIQCHQGLDGSSQKTEVQQGSLEVRGRQAADDDSITRLELTSARAQSGTRPNPGGERHHDLDRSRRIEIKSEHPGCGCTAEHRIARKGAMPGGQNQPGVGRELSPAVELGSKTLPAPALERAQREPVVAGLLQGKGPVLQLFGNTRTSPHAARMRQKVVAANPACKRILSARLDPNVPLELQIKDRLAPSVRNRVR